MRSEDLQIAPEGLFPLGGEHLGRARLRTARGPVEGDLYVHEVKLIAEFGEPLSVDSILFISPEWRAPSFLGYMGFLDRLRFAVDPSRNRFFFGSLD